MLKIYSNFHVNVVCQIYNNLVHKISLIFYIIGVIICDLGYK